VYLARDRVAIELRSTTKGFSVADKAIYEVSERREETLSSHCPGPDTLDLDNPDTEKRILQHATAAIAETIRAFFKLTLDTDVEIGSAVTERKTTLRRTVAGMIGWVGKWSGTGIVDCSPECACLITKLMLGTDGDILNEDALDVVAEVANVIFGGMKTELEAELGPIGLGLPTVIYGTEMGMRCFGMAHTILPVQLHEHTIYVKLYMCKAPEEWSIMNLLLMPLVGQQSL
jgi:CheY-specific phosphatase CheX